MALATCAEFDCNYNDGGICQTKRHCVNKPLVITKGGRIMKIVIEIDDDDYQFIKDTEFENCVVTKHLYEAVYKGMPLPKNHGRLIDEKIIIGMVDKDSNGIYDLTDMPEYIAGLPAIIPAESEEE